MRAMVLSQLGSVETGTTPLILKSLPTPVPKADEVLVRVRACGVCHTELDEIEGRLPPPSLPIILGHQIVGTVAGKGERVSRFHLGDRVGVAWIFSACGDCRFCRSDRENLCPNFQATGRDANGGYAEFAIVPEAFAYPIPAVFSDVQAAPLLCAGAIGYRSLRLCGLEDSCTLGLTGFGASSHLVLKMAKYRYPNARVFAFARNPRQQAFARDLGADWAGDTTAMPPEPLSCIIDTTPAWKPIVEALERLEPGGRLVINAIRKEAGDRDYLLRLDYPKHLWQEKEIKSVANVTRQDVSEFLNLAAEMKIQPEVQTFALEDANRALLELKTGKIRGAKVLAIA